MRLLKLPGMVGYVSIALWFLLMVMAPSGVRAQELVTTDAAVSGQSVLIPVTDLVPALEAALASKGADADAEITINEPGLQIPVTPGVDPIFHSVSFSPASGRFLIRAQGAPGTPAIVIAGTAIATTRIPVLSRDIAKGELITSGDLEWIESANPRIAFFLTDPIEIIGKAARRTLRGGTSLRRYDIETPILVKKGDLVTMTLVSAGLRLSHMGVALNSGGAGDVIAIKNVKSDRVIKAIVRGKNIAEIPSRESALDPAQISENF